VIASDGAQGGALGREGGPEERAAADGGRPAAAATPGGSPPCFEEVEEAAIGT